MNNQDFMTCPYDSSHQVHKTRMPRHLIKCQRNYPDVCKKICPYNKLHVLDPHQYEYHLTVCEARKDFENIIYEAEKIKPSDIPGYEVQNIPIRQSSENWDDSETSVSYHSHLVNQSLTNPVTRYKVLLDQKSSVKTQDKSEEK